MGKASSVYRCRIVGLALLSGILLSTAIAAEDKPIIQFGERAWGQRPRPKIQQWAVYPAAGQQFIVYHADIVEPPADFEVTLETKLPGVYEMVADGRKVRLSATEPTRVTLSGREGWRTLQILKDGKRVGESKIIVQTGTYFSAGEYARLFTPLYETVRKDRKAWSRGGRTIHTNPSWVRDHVHEMKAYKYWEQDLNSYIDALIDMQQPGGFFFEILAGAGFSHLQFVDEKFTRVEPQDDIAFMRLELEADVEYLIVEGAYNIWQATGDIEAMKKRLDALDKGLMYYFKDPTRWDAEHGAVKRPFTIDTWDFTFGYWDRNRRIEPNTPMGIMHGDNSGLYQACGQLTEMYRAAGNEERSDYWENKARDFGEHINELCWNGTYYLHHILLQPVDTGTKEEDILSLSNSYSINRGLPTHKMAVRIIDEYQRRREIRKATHFAEWFSIDPPYPVFGPYKAGYYINGGIASFVAGELAKAAFNHGREAYGADILKRVARKMMEDDGRIYFLYSADGRNMGGGPSGWGAAAIVSALIEGMAGIVDNAATFSDVTISPRFLAAGIDEAKVCARYGPSAAYTAMHYMHSPGQRTISLKLAGVSQKTRLRVLLPESVNQARLAEPQGIEANIEKIENSHYLAFDLPVPLSDNVADVKIQY